MDYGVFPLIRNVGSRDAGIGDMKEDTTDSWESGFQHADAHTVCSTGGCVSHVENRMTELAERDRSRFKTARHLHGGCKHIARGQCLWSGSRWQCVDRRIQRRS